MLVVLADRGRLSTTKLREELGVDKNQRINYRGKRVLGAGQEPDDLALELVANNSDGEGRQPMLEWWLTDRGQAYVNEHRDALARPQTTSEAIDVSREALDTATEVEQRMQQLEGQFGRLRADVSDAVGTAREASKDVDETLAGIEHTIHELVQAEIRQSVLELRGDCDALIENQQELEDRIDSLESEVEAAATKDEVDDWVGNIEELVMRNQGRLGKVESGQESHGEEIEELREQVADQEQQLQAIEETLTDLQKTVEKGPFDGLLG
jgi:chromosome segregation ATPase